MGGPHGLMDNLTYTYSGNRLSAVNDAISGEYEVDFVKRGGGTYGYHANGALNSDENEKISSITYNTFLNLPEQVNLNDGRWIKYTYDGAGTLLKTEYSNGEYWEYVEGVVFKNGQPYQMAIPEGRAVYESSQWKLEYDIKDHLGNTRVSFREGVGGAELKAKTDFDPWGVRLNGTGVVNGFQNRWELQGKEKEMTFGLNRVNFGARVYNPTIGRFDRVDPLAEERYSLTPYNYNSNNPVSRIDPTGALDEPCCGDDPTKDQFLFAKLAVTAFYDTKHAVYNTALRVFGSDLRAGYKVENGQEVFETSFTRKEADNSVSGVINEVVATVADAAIIVPGGNTTGKVFAQTSKSQGARAAKDGADALVKQAGELVKLNSGKNSVTLKTPKEQIRYDLAGKAHGNVPTPHKQVYNKNFVNGEVKSVTRASKEAIPMTQQEVRMIRKYLEKIDNK